jgi:hypothetical protein
MLTLLSNVSDYNTELPRTSEVIEFSCPVLYITAKANFPNNRPITFIDAIFAIVIIDR